MNTPVNFKLAKLLKEKGFDVPVRNYYLQKEKGNYIHEGFEDNYWGDNRIVNWNKDIVGIKPFEGFLSAPTIAEVVMWSFNTHKIWITVDVNINGKFNYLLRQFNSKDRAWEVKNPSSIQEYFNNPDDAYSSGITYFLNNLKMSN